MAALLWDYEYPSVVVCFIIRGTTVKKIFVLPWKTMHCLHITYPSELSHSAVVIVSEIFYNTQVTENLTK